MPEDFENFTDDDEEWLAELESRAADLQSELFDWREARSRAETKPREGLLRAQPRPASRRPDGSAGPARRRVVEDEDLAEEDEDPTTVFRPRSGWPEAGRRPPSAQRRTQALIDRGRSGRGRSRVGRSRKKVVLGAAGAAMVVVIACLFIFRPGPSWPASVATVQSEITTACQNPDVSSEPGQVNFACAKATSQILWVFALMTSGDRPQFTDAKTGRVGLEPIAPTQGGQLAWSLNLHHPYNPRDPVDSLEVAARAINNIIGGATLTSTSGKPTVQPGLESDPANCARYTGSSAVVSRAGFPSMCAQPVTSSDGQAALVADTFRQWEVGATAVAAYDVGVLFANANNPGNAQVQAILKTLPNTG